MNQGMAKHGPRMRVATASLVVLGLWSGISNDVDAQVVWDPDRYLSLSRDGETRFYQAMALEDGDAQRDPMLYAAGSLLKQALSMLREAILSETVDGVLSAAWTDLFTLTENLSVIWLRLGQCAPAERLIDEALSRAELSETGQRFFEGLIAEVEACRIRVHAWEWPRYAGLVARAELRLAQATRGRDDFDRALLDQAARASEDALEQYRDALFLGRLGDMPVSDPVVELFERYDATLVMLNRLGECEWVERFEALAHDDAATLMSVQVPPLPQLDGATECASHSESPQPRLGIAPEEAAPDESPSELRQVAAYALLGTSAVLAAGLVAIDISSADERDELDGLQNACALGTCDAERAHELADTIDGRKTVAWVLLGASVVSGALGVILLLTGDGDTYDTDSLAATVVPTTDGRTAGVALQFRY